MPPRKGPPVAPGPLSAPPKSRQWHRRNGATIATGSTAQLAWSVAEQLVYLTRYLRLGPGDVVLTGCPGTFAPVESGDLAVVMIDGIGELSNPIRTPG